MTLGRLEWSCDGPGWPHRDHRIRTSRGYKLPTMTKPESIRLIALDLDGTLVKGQNGVTARVRAAVRSAQDAGIQITIATGRMYQSARRFAEDLGVTIPIICYQGAMVRDPVTDEVFVHDTVPHGPASAAIEFARGIGLHVNAYLDDRLYMEADTPEGRFYAASSQVVINLVDDLVIAIEHGTTKLVFVTDEDHVLDTIAALESHLGDDVRVTRSHPRFAEVIGREVSKGRALRAVAASVGVPIQATMAIGDNLNDLDLVMVAGIGVAMGDGDPRVVASADWVTGTYEEDGVAQAIDRILNTVTHPS